MLILWAIIRVWNEQNKRNVLFVKLTEWTYHFNRNYNIIKLYRIVYPHSIHSHLHVSQFLAISISNSPNCSPSFQFYALPPVKRNALCFLKNRGYPNSCNPAKRQTFNHPDSFNPRIFILPIISFIFCHFNN